MSRYDFCHQCGQRRPCWCDRHTWPGEVDGEDRGNPDPLGKSDDVAASLPEPPARDRDFVPCPTMEGYLRVHPEILTGEVPPEALEEIRQIVDRLRDPHVTGIVIPHSEWLEWVPFDPYPRPRADRAPHGTGIVLAVFLGALFWAAFTALLWIALSLIGGGT